LLREFLNGARALATGDFDGDGEEDLEAATDEEEVW
jgi:hypothetical protein